jgi:sugar lactone lactonase YvrE
VLIPRPFHWTFLLFAAALGEASDSLKADNLNYSVSWIGNSYSGKDQWVQQDVDGIFVDEDGTLFTNVFWDEGGNNVEQYDEKGDFVRAARHTHGWGYEGGEAVAANSKYVFIAQKVGNEDGGLVGGSWPVKGFTWSGVSRRDRSDMTRGVPFPGGHGDKGDVLLASFLPVLTIPNKIQKDAANPTLAVQMPPDKGEGGIRGMWATETRLYVSCPFDETIKIYDTENMKLLATWPVPRPDRLCADASRNLWILQRPEKPGDSWRALTYNEKGTPLAASITFPPAMIPSALCVDGQDRLLVTDDGVDQQVKIYNHLDVGPQFVGTLGIKGGIWAPPHPGLFGDLRFNHLTGVGADKEGKIYVASSGSVDGGSTVLECYDAKGELVWRRLGLAFVDGGAIDPDSETDLYTKDKHFTLDYTQSPGANWSYTGYTANPWKYPDDPRFNCSSANVWLRRISGRKFLYVSDMDGHLLRFYRFNPETDGEIAIPCGLFSPQHLLLPSGYPPGQPAAGEWIWTDMNGNVTIDGGEYQHKDGESSQPFFPDENGAIWNLTSQGLRCLPVVKISDQGVPQYDLTRATLYPLPGDLDQVRRIHYETHTDTLFLAGNKGADHNQHWKPMGPVLCAYDHWTKGGKLRWKVVLPYEVGTDGMFSHEPQSFDVAGDYVFVAYDRGLSAEKSTEAFIKVYRVSDGTFIGNLSAEKDLGQIGLLDLVESVRAFRRASGEYVVILEEDAKAKLILFLWKP